MKRYLLITILTLVCTTRCLADDIPVPWGLDAGRAAIILAMSEQAKKAYNAQERAQLALTGMHIFVREEVEATTDFQREFKDYLKQFHRVLRIAAEVYGLYYEVSQLTYNINEYMSLIDEGKINPENAIALALDGRRNYVYSNVINSGVSIAKDLYKIFTSSAKMTEKERLQVVMGMRPKLKKINKQLKVLSIALKYTTWMTLWQDLAGYNYHPKSRREIAEAAMGRWRMSTTGQMAGR